MATLKAQLAKQGVPPALLDQAIAHVSGAAAPAQPAQPQQPPQPIVRPQGVPPAQAAPPARPAQPAPPAQPPRPAQAVPPAQPAQPAQAVPPVQPAQPIGAAPAAQPAVPGGKYQRHPKAVKPTGPPVPPKSKRSFILVVDDDELIRDMIVSKLEAAGYRVTSAMDAAESVIQAEGMKISLIVSDIEMPGFGSGVDALKKLRTSGALPKNLPVVFVTGMPPKEAQKLMPKADPYIRLIHKPVDWKLLETYIYDLTLQDNPLV